MIRILKYGEIDFQKYQTCLANSVQQNLYAQKEILDQLCESWEILVYGNYDFVMPVPLKNKFGFQIVLTPLFCQQLGVFGKEENQIIEQKFYDFLQKNFKISYYAFNFQNTFKENLKTKKNYFIEKINYQILRKKYFKGRKSTVKTAQYLSFKELKLEETVVFCRNNFKGLDKKKDLEKFFHYLEFLDERKMLNVYGSFKGNDLTNVALIINQNERFSLLGLINDEKFKADNGASFLIDHILKNYIQEKSFDFMGGSIRGIEVFFKSFGSQLQEYSVIENSKKDLLKSFFWTY